MRPSGSEPRGRHVICHTDELPPGQRRIVELGGLSIGVFNVKGRYYALYNRCPHRGAPLCLGPTADAVIGPAPYEYRIEREGEILRCPWHGWEFDIATGRSWFNPHRLRVRAYDVRVEENPDLPDHVTRFPVAVEEQLVVVYLNKRPAEG